MPTPRFDPDDVLECARSIRPYLPDLLGAEAKSFDDQLANLLAQTNAEEPVDTQILELLSSQPKTRIWTAEFLAPQQIKEFEIRGYQRLPGSSDVVPARKFICPFGDYVWYQRSVGVPVPVCPTHPEFGELIPD